MGGRRGGVWCARTTVEELHAGENWELANLGIFLVRMLNVRFVKIIKALIVHSPARGETSRKTLTIVSNVKK